MRRTGFTLTELLFTLGIVASVLAGLLQLFIYCLHLAQLAGNLTVAVSQAQGKLEELRNHNYADIVTDYASSGTPGNMFTFTQPNGTGVVYIDSSNAALLKVEVVVSFRTPPNRIIGEDNGSGTGGIPLDGQLNGSEDANENNKLDSPTSLVSYIARR